eukprot:TRINITY_DN4756_c0_g4_i1.p1 TRINITY_DN4756_c0_g4~~TRINITY_DN4756_c0_g4_i1.p1  ORF type:complete len:723 (+),score=72.87 TRINITY_DN4756_c0_g4_i1:130-2298(+)
MEFPTNQAEEFNFHMERSGGCTTINFRTFPVVEAELQENSIGREFTGFEGHPIHEPYVGVSIADEGDNEIREPYEGMEFDSEEAVKIFYNEYARHMGFGTRVGHSYRSKKDRNFISRKIVCVKAGFRDQKEASEGKTKRPRASSRVGCEAMILVRKQESGKWVLIKFVKEHNHTLESPSTVHLIRSHRHVQDPARNPVQSIDRTGFAPRRIMPLSIEECVGIGNIGFFGQDCKNLLRTERRRTFGNDAQMVLEYFQRKQAENPAFFYAIQVDEDQQLANVFWVDARSRLAYEYFGDVVTFDTTYQTNRFRVPLASFTGVNHHRQPLLFGCALISYETEATFVWLFRTWLLAMAGRHPISILTDQDETITAAVKHVFPKTHHRFCMRHIQRKKQDKLSHVLHAHKQFENDFRTCIYETETSEDFERSWQWLIEKYDLSNNEWLRSLYQDRRQWVPLYIRDKFFADMTAQQSESALTFFDGFVHAQTTLQAFFPQYEKAVASRSEKETEADFDTRYTTPILKTPSVMEEQAAGIYTKKIFSVFQEELVETWNYVAKKREEDGGVATYGVARFDQQHKVYLVMFDASQEKASCSCKMFEFSGILCRHILSVLIVAGIFRIPSPYILTRWTRNAKNRGLHDDRNNEMHQSLLMRFNALYIEAVKCAEEGSTSMGIFNFALGALRDTKERILAAKEGTLAAREGTVKDGQGRNLVTGSSLGDKSRKV